MPVVVLHASVQEPKEKFYVLVWPTCSKTVREATVIFFKNLIWFWQHGRPSVGPMTAHNTAPDEEANCRKFLSRTWPLGRRGVPDSCQRVPGTGMLRPCVSTSSTTSLHNTLPFCCHPNRAFRWEKWPYSVLCCDTTVQGRVCDFTYSHFLLNLTFTRLMITIFDVPHR